MADGSDGAGAGVGVAESGSVGTVFGTAGIGVWVGELVAGGEDAVGEGVLEGLVEVV